MSIASLQSIPAPPTSRNQNWMITERPCSAAKPNAAGSTMRDACPAASVETIPGKRVRPDVGSMHRTPLPMGSDPAASPWTKIPTVLAGAPSIVSRRLASESRALPRASMCAVAPVEFNVPGQTAESCPPRNEPTSTSGPGRKLLYEPYTAVSPARSTVVRLGSVVDTWVHVPPIRSKR